MLLQARQDGVEPLAIIAQSCTWTGLGQVVMGNQLVRERAVELAYCTMRRRLSRFLKPARA